MDTPAKHIRRFEVKGDRLVGGEVFAPCDAGMFDGIRLDATGRVWAAAHDGVHCFDPDGTLIGKLLFPDPCPGRWGGDRHVTVSNLCFGGPKRNRLFVTATTSVYSWLLTTDGAPPPYDRG